MIKLQSVFRNYKLSFCASVNVIPMFGNSCLQLSRWLTHICYNLCKRFCTFLCSCLS